MPAPVESYSPGLPVEIGKIDKELKKLWEQNEGATRASLVNLAVYNEAPDSLPGNTRLISEFTQNLACRAIVIEANPTAKENQVEAWISAHCHISRAGSKQICSEQLSFRLQGPSASLLPNIVFSQLDSDLPFLLWWQGEFHDPIDPQLWAWVDRLIYDSQIWKNFTEQLELLESAQQQAHQRVVLCDLNWTRLDKIRLALAQFFDHPSSYHRFEGIDRGEIVFAPSYRSTGLLLAGWLAAQLQWRVEGKGATDKLTFFNNEGRRIEIGLREEPGEPVGKISLVSTDVEFQVIHRPGADLLEVSRGKPGEDRTPQVMPAASNEIVHLMADELNRGGPHKVYLRAIHCVRTLL
ncbi:MAG TPA: glucose-6-phosphate dehydrogenase assembly protein OpcA [Chthoniobacterales bacterium]